MGIIGSEDKQDKGQYFAWGSLLLVKLLTLRIKYLKRYYFTQKVVFDLIIDQLAQYSLQVLNDQKMTIIPLTPMGVLAPVSAQRDTPLSPPSTSAEIFRRTCLHSNL
jgi:hypothetical protein